MSTQEILRKAEALLSAWESSAMTASAQTADTSKSTGSDSQTVPSQPQSDKDNPFLAKSTTDPTQNPFMIQQPVQQNPGSNEIPAVSPSVKSGDGALLSPRTAQKIAEEKQNEQNNSFTVSTIFAQHEKANENANALTVSEILKQNIDLAIHTDQTLEYLEEKRKEEEDAKKRFSNKNLEALRQFYRKEKFIVNLIAVIVFCLLMIIILAATK
jgi:hypothetical protein